MNGMYASPPSNTAPCLLQAVISKWNDQATLEARGRYSAEIARVQQAHASHCEAVQAQHDAVCLQIQQHNEAIWPQFTIAKAAQEELDRVGRFVEHIRWGVLLGSTENIAHNRTLCFASVDWLLASLIRQLSVSRLSTHALGTQASNLQQACIALVSSDHRVSLAACTAIACFTIKGLRKCLLVVVTLSRQPLVKSPFHQSLSS